MRTENIFEFTGFFNSDGHKLHSGKYRLGMQGIVEVNASTFTEALKKLKKEFKAFKLVSYRVFTILKTKTICKRKFKVKGKEKKKRPAPDVIKTCKKLLMKVAVFVVGSIRIR